MSVQSWVRADCAALDPVLHDAVPAWVERDWPFDSIEYAFADLTSQQAYTKRP